MAEAIFYVPEFLVFCAAIYYYNLLDTMVELPCVDYGCDDSLGVYY